MSLLFRLLVPFVLVLSACGGGDETPATSAQCSDGIKNGDESEIDCGGSCNPCGGVSLNGVRLRGDNDATTFDFGEAVATDGSTLVVGFPGDVACVGEVCTPSGSVYVYNLEDNGTVTFVERLVGDESANNTTGNAWFGRDVAIQGDTLVVGADFSAECGAANMPVDECTQSGKAYIFERSGGSFMLAHELYADNSEAFDRFGHSVSIDDDWIVVGAVGEATCGNPEPTSIDRFANGASCGNSGAAYFFKKEGNVWAQAHYAKGTSIYTSSRFGSAVAIQGNTALLGADGQSRLSIHRYDGSDWSLLVEIGAVELEDYGFGAVWEGVGAAMAFDGDRVVIGGASAAGIGEVFIVELDEQGDWSVVQKLSALATDAQGRFGASVSVSPDGQRLVAGAPTTDQCATPEQATGKCVDSGSVHVYNKEGDAWLYAGRKTQALSTRDAYFGSHVAATNAHYLTSAPREAGCERGINGGPNSEDEAACGSRGAAYLYSFE